MQLSISSGGSQGDMMGSNTGSGSSDVMLTAVS